MRVVYFCVFFLSGLFTFLFLLVSPLGEQHYLATKKEEVFSPSIPTLESIFDEGDAWTATLSASRVRVMKVTGDVIPARTVNFQTIQRGDFLWPYSPTAEFISDADITYIDLETPLLNMCPQSNEGFIFCGDMRHVQGIKLMGVDVANLANNHIGNFGFEGVSETVDHLEREGIVTSGVDETSYIDVDGVTFAFVGYNDIGVQVGVNHANEEFVVSQIEEASTLADVVVAQFHWGVEYVSQPSSRQIVLAHLAIDNGADVVIGNHPHWVQPVEVYGDGVIVYAHGNFIFDQMWSDKTREGVVGTYTFYDDTLVDISFRPLVIHDFGQARWAEGEDEKRILNDMKLQSERHTKISY